MANFKTVNGVQYRVVTDRDAQVGDYLMYGESHGDYIVAEKPYKVVEIDSFDDPQIIDEHGETYDTVGDEDDYELLEKIGTVPNELVTHEGVTYRKVAREAELGEKIIVVDAKASGGGYKNGDVLNVTSTSVGGAQVSEAAVGLWHSEYVVLEPISIDEELTAAQARVAELEAMKRKADRLKVGEYAKVVKVDMTYASVGQIVKVVHDDESHAPYYTKNLDGMVTGWFREGALVRATDEEVAEALRQIEREKIKPGVYVKLTIADGEEPKYGWGRVNNGDIGKVRLVNGNSVHVDFPEYPRWHAHIDELTIATEEEVTAEVERQHAADQFKPGDKVRLVSGGREFPLLGFDDGGIYTVGFREDDGRVTIKRQDGKKGYAKPYQLEKAADEEVNWAEIGRKVGEFKAGDTVRFLSAPGPHGLSDYVGIITTVDLVDESKMLPYHLSAPDFVNSDYDTWTRSGELELIAPVESSVNLRVA